MSDFSAEIVANIDFRRSEKSNYGVVQDQVVVKHSVELERGSDYQEAESIYRTTQSHPSNGEILYNLEDLPFTVIGEDISTSIIGTNYSKIKGFSIYNRSGAALSFRLPFFTGTMLVGASGEVHSSNMDGWVVNSGDQIGISGSEGQSYDILFLSAPIPFYVTGELNGNYEFISPVTNTGLFNYSFSGQLSVGFSGGFETLIDVSNTGTFSYENLLDVSKTNVFNYEHLLNVNSLVTIPYENTDVTPVLRSILLLNYEYLMDVNVTSSMNYEYLEDTGSGDYGMLFGFWF